MSAIDHPPDLPATWQPPPRPPLSPPSAVRHIKLAPHQVTDRLTATRDLFVLAHFGIPRVDPAAWTLTIDGLIGRAATFTLDDLKARPRKVVEAVHQCCGSPFEPTVPTRRVANVRWAGVDLATLLGDLGVDRRARFLWSYGLDGGDFAGTACDWYVKDLPVDRLAEGDVLVAYELNGEPLPAEHGFPARLVVPGYYGTNSVKWLWRLHLADRHYDGLFTTTLYVDPPPLPDGSGIPPRRRPVRAVAPESVIVAPAPDAVVPLGKEVGIWGWAWSHNGVDGVEISFDGGPGVPCARLAPRRNRGWQRFSLPWCPVRPGGVLISARATAMGGARQPATGARNAVHEVHFVVR